MSDATPPQVALAKLRELLAQKAIDQSTFELLSAPHRADNLGSGAVAQGDRAQAVGEKGIGIGGNNLAPIDNSTHFHLGAGDAAAKSQALRKSYLGRMWRQANAVVSLLASGDSRDAVRLAAVYTALLTERREESAAKSGSARGLVAEAMGQNKSARLSAIAVLDTDHRLVLLGGPGSGKSTFVNFVAQAMAGELLGAEAEWPEPNLATLTAPLPPEEDSEPNNDAEPAAPQPWHHGPLIPVVVLLRDLAAQLPPPAQTVGADNVWRYVCSVLQGASLAEYAPALKAELQDRGGLVMFDGLDEVPDANTRRQQIQQVVQDFAATFGKCRILVTSRTYAYQQQDWKLPGFAEAALSPFSPGQIRSFVQAWYHHMAQLQRLTHEDAQGRAAVLLRQVQHNPRVRELAERPLLLTLFARLQTEKGGTLPERREELYFAAVDLLLNDWERMKVRRSADGSTPEVEPSLSEWLNASREDIRKQLDRLAFEAHRDQKDLTGTADIRQADLVQALLRASAKQEDVKVRRLEGYLRDRAGILVEHGVAMLQFPHRTFQEYLAACHLANDGFPDKLADLVRQDPLRWREVALLAAAHAARGNTSLPTWALSEALCPDAPTSASASAPDAWGALLAGQVLAASGEYLEPAARNRGKLERVRGWQVALLAAPVLPSAERALAGRTLAALGDPRPEVMTLDGMQFCLVPPGPFMMGDDNAGADEKPEHSVDLDYPYFMSRFPVTVAQWREWLKLTGRAPDDQDSLRGRDNEPVVSVTWHDALHFCKALTGQWRAWLPKGFVVTLPSEAEWEKAARGGVLVPDESRWFPAQQLGPGMVSSAKAATVKNLQPRRQYPWGEDFDADKANAQMTIGQTSAAGCFVAGASPYGCEEMSGNMWEWTRSLWGEDFLKPSFKYPYKAEDRKREDLTASDKVLRVVRSGSWVFPADDARCACRYWLRPDLRDLNLGFRVVLRSAPVSKP